MESQINIIRFAFCGFAMMFADTDPLIPLFNAFGKATFT